MSTKRTSPWMQTYSGRQFHPTEPHHEDICIGDIAHALSHICRFGGHVRQFYSVAQHSVIVASILPPELKLAGLLHDATEAYLVDIPRPLKVALPEYKRIEHQLEALISRMFGVSFASLQIKHADNVALVTEARDLLGEVPKGWELTHTCLPDKITPLPPECAKAEFLKAFKTYNP